MRPRLPALLLLALVFVADTGCYRGGHHVGHQVAPGVVFLGGRDVAFRVDRDTFVVGRDTGRFTRLRFEVDDAPVAVHSVVIEFGNGQTYAPDTRLVFGEGAWSRELDLPGDARFIRRVTFLYESVGRPIRGHARVRLFGLR